MCRPGRRVIAEGRGRTHRSAPTRRRVKDAAPYMVRVFVGRDDPARPPLAPAESSGATQVGADIIRPRAARGRPYMAHLL